MSNDDDAETLEAAVGATDDDHEEPHEEGCVIGEGGDQTQVDFEITGASDPDESDTPETPDMSCTTREGTAFCQVIPPSSGGGEQHIAAWIDFDNDDSTVELDREEGVDDEDTDATDKALWTWTHGDPPPDGKRFATKVTMRFEEDIFRGTVLSTRRRCMRFRIVTLKRERGGTDEVVGRVKTNRSGRWRLERRPSVRGDIYARVGRYDFTASNGELVVCLGDRSRSVRVR